MASNMRLFVGNPGLRSCIRSRSLLCSWQCRIWAQLDHLSARRITTSASASKRPSPKSTHHHPSSQRPDSSAPKQARGLTPMVLAVVAIFGGTGYYLGSPPSRPDTLNERFFVPYTITAREAISPTSFVFTAEPDTPNPSHPYLLPRPKDSSSSPAQWRWPLWSVEFKQPEVQIARHYTPLPPQEGDDPADGVLRFYVRAVGDGEMSHYLARRQVGHLLHLRGPHPGFELVERLGDMSRVVFLAGGTGVVPGLQAARAVLEAREDTTFDLLWAVRRREELQDVPRPPTASRWKFWSRSQAPTELSQDVVNPSVVGKQMAEMKAKYGDRLRIQVVVDAERTSFQSKHIEDTIVRDATHFAPVIDPFKNGCRFHDQTMHIGATEYADPDGPGCVCPTAVDGFRPGKNLFIVSGPDGFVRHYAGSKIWVDGNQTQGPVGGVIGQLRHRHHQLAEDWLVLKM